MRREDLTIETPCSQDWNGMKPADMKKRFCDECRLHVHDLAAMSKREAKAVLASETTEGLCIRYLYDQHGTVVFADDPRLVAPNALVRAKRFVQGAIVVALPMTLTACMGAAAARPPMPPTQVVTDAGAPTNPIAADAGAPTTQTTPVAK